MQIPEPFLSKLLFSDTNMGWFWLIVRIWVGYQWLMAGYEKVINPAWVGASAGSGVRSFLLFALTKSSGLHPDVSGWYAWFIKMIALPNAHVFSYIIAFGELAVGLGLILGVFTGITAFFGSFMNMNYLLAGTVSTNPVLLFSQLFLILAWRVAGWIGFDRWLLPLLGTPWYPGKVFKKYATLHQ